MKRIQFESDHYLRRLGGVDFHCPRDAALVARLRWINTLANEFSVHIVTVNEKYIKEAARAIRAWDQLIHKIITLNWKVRAEGETTQDARTLCQATLERLQSNVENAVDRYRRRLIRRRRCIVPTFVEELQEKFLIEKFRRTFSAPVSATTVLRPVCEQGRVCSDAREDASSASGKLWDGSVV